VSHDAPAWPDADEEDDDEEDDDDVDEEDSLDAGAVDGDLLSLLHAVSTPSNPATHSNTFSRFMTINRRRRTDGAGR